MKGGNRTTNLFLPPAVLDQVEKLNALVEANPQYIPVPEAAKFLGVNPDGLRHSIDSW